MTNTITIVAVYVDDLILMTSGLDQMVQLKEKLADQFKMKDMGPLHYLLGISVLQGEDCIIIHQKQYILKLLKKFRMEDAKPVSTPADVSVKLTKEDGVSKDGSSTEFQSLIESLLYAAIATRPDISQQCPSFAQTLPKLILLPPKEYSSISKTPS